MTPEQAFGLVLMELRRDRGLSQEELAEAAGCTRPYVSYLENARHGPSLAMLFGIATALHTTPADILLAVQAKLRGPDN